MCKRNYSFLHKANRRRQILAIIANIYALISLVILYLLSCATVINTNICMCVWVGWDFDAPHSSYYEITVYFNKILYALLLIKIFGNIPVHVDCNAALTQHSFNGAKRGLCATNLI